MEKKTELVIVDIDKSLRITRKENVFPLSTTHRKELRQLKYRNIGSLQTQVANIRKLKMEEYKTKYWKEIIKENESKKELLSYINNDMDNRVLQIRQILSERRKLEEKHKELLDDSILTTGYDMISKLDSDKDGVERKYLIDDQYIDKILKERFKEKYQVAFDEVDKKIQKLEELYEEAINFGDLEQVKRIYYILKQTEDFVNSISELKI